MKDIQGLCMKKHKIQKQIKNIKLDVLESPRNFVLDLWIGMWILFLTSKERTNPKEKCFKVLLFKPLSFISSEKYE